MKQTKFWIILILIIFILSIAASVAVFLFRGNGNIISIYQHGKLIDKINLDTVTTPYSFTVESNHGGYNVIQVEQGRICVTEASCPDHICINTGWLSDGVIPIVCLPNELVIQSDNSHSSVVDISVQ